MDTKYQAGDTIQLKDLRAYEVLNVSPRGYLVAEVTRKFEMTPVHYFTFDFLKEAHRRGAVLENKHRSTQTVTQKLPASKRKKHTAA